MGPECRDRTGSGGPATQETRSRGWICFAGQDWWYHNRAHSDFQLMRRVATEEPVLVVNSIGLRMPVPGRSSQAVRRILRKLGSLRRYLRRPLPELPNYVVMTPLAVPLYGSARMRRVNAALLSLQIGLVARALGMRTPHVLATLPTAVDTIRRLPAGCVFYNRSDQLSEYPEGDRETLRALEADLMAVADRVLYVSRALMAADEDHTAGRAVYLDHGVDLQHFRARPEQDQPADVSTIPRPRVGFFGGIDDYVVDLALLERVATEIPEAQLVLIGDSTCSLEPLRRLDNVHVLGFRPYEDIPAYGSAFDVALMPWVDSRWITMCNPIKLKEYLALGLPVVSTAFPEVERYGDVVHVARSSRQFVDLVREALREPGPELGLARRAAVGDADWGRRSSALRALAAEVFVEKP